MPRILLFLSLAVVLASCGDSSSLSSSSTNLAKSVFNRNQPVQQQTSQTVKSAGSGSAVATYNPVNSLLTIPQMQVAGDTSGTTYSIDMTFQGGILLVTSALPVGTMTQTTAMATYNPTTGVVSIPYATVVGDTSGTQYTLTLQQQAGTLNFSVANATIASSFSIADLNGLWVKHGLQAGDSPQWFGWWHQNTAISGNIITTTGSVESPGTSTPDSTGSLSGSMMSSDGIFSFTTFNPTFQGVMTKSKALLVTTSSSKSNPGSQVIELWLKKTGTFSTADLAGTWYMNYLLTGDSTNGGNGWLYATVNCNANGACTMTQNGRSDTSSLKTGNYFWALSTDGTFTELGSSSISASVYGSINSDKSLLIFTRTDSGGGGAGLGILVKAGATYSQSDVAGTWLFHALQTSDGANKWYRGTYNASPSGVGSFSSMLDSDGKTALPNTSGEVMTLWPNGIITTIGSSNSQHGVMSSDKNLIIMTKFGGGVYPQLWIGVKR